MKKLIIILFPFISCAQIDNAIFQQEFTKVFNAYRVSNNLDALKINTDANSAAKIQSDYLASTYHRDSSGKIIGLLGHCHPDKNLYSPELRLAYVNPSYTINTTTSIGENVLVVMDYDLVSMQDFANKVLTIWKKSPGHNALLLSERQSFGVSVTHTSFESPYIDYEVDVTTMSNKPVTKYRTIHYYTASLVLIGELKWY